MSENVKRICVIGLGQFGRELAVSFARHAEVLAIDADQAVVNQISEEVHRAYSLNASDYAALASVVDDDFDEAVVSFSQNMEASILAVLHLKKIGVKRVHAKARNKDHAQILEAIGADDIIFPERDTARRLVRQILNPNLLDFVPISEDYSVMQIAPPAWFVGRSLRDLDLRRRFGIFIIAIKELVPEHTFFLPEPDTVIRDDIILIAIGRPDALHSMSEAAPEEKGLGVADGSGLPA